MSKLPESWGLYEPNTEHDECGVGFVANIKGVKSREIVEQGLEILRRLAHRGASRCDPETGDGAGILMQLPHEFLIREGQAVGFEMPMPGRYAVGLVFLPSDVRALRACEQILEEAIESEGQKLLGWRAVPVDPSVIGRIAREVMPTIRQVFAAGWCPARSSGSCSSSGSWPRRGSSSAASIRKRASM